MLHHHLTGQLTGSRGDAGTVCCAGICNLCRLDMGRLWDFENCLACIQGNACTPH
jgi:hypothetical protein